MSKIDRVNHHHYHGVFGLGSLPIDTYVEVGDVAFEIGNGLQECFAVGPVQWQQVGGGGAPLGTITLDQAYDHTGGGAGRLINVDSGEIDLSLTGAQAMKVRLGANNIIELNNNTSAGEIKAKNTAGDRTMTLGTVGLDWSVTTAKVDITTSDDLEIAPTGDLILKPSSNILYDTPNNTLNFEQSSVFFGGADFKNGVGESFHVGGKIGDLIGETSSSLVHALNSLGEVLGKFVGTDGELEKFGVNNVPIGQENITINFTSAFANANYAVVVTLGNTSATFTHVAIAVKDKTVNGFTVALSDTVLTGNYTINWHAKLVH